MRPSAPRTPSGGRRAIQLGGRVTAAALAATALAGCGGTSPGEPAGPADAGAGAFPRTVEHAMGETPIENAPQRIVALDHTFVDAALALETEVVGYTTFTADDTGLPDYLGEAKAKYAADAQSVGLLTEPKVEQIAALQPDLILSAKVRHEALYDELSGIAPTVFTETTGATWKDNLLLVGEAVGKERRARELIETYEQRAAAIGDAIREKSGENPTVSIVRFAGEPTVRLYTEDSYAGVVVDDVGLAWPQDRPTSEDIAVDLSQERILDLDADHIFVCTYADETGTAAEVQEEFQASPLWGQLEGEIHPVDDTTWMTAVGLLGAHEILDDLAETFGVDPARADG